MASQQRVSFNVRLGALLLLALVATSAAVTPRPKPSPVRRSIGKNAPFPGVRRCVLLANLSPFRVLSANLSGDALAHGAFRVTVYQQDLAIHLKVHFDVEWLSGPLPPRNQTIFEGRRGTNGAPRLALPATWAQGSTPTEIKMDAWIANADRKVVTGSATNETVYSLIQRIDANPLGFYVQINTQTYPEGAVRGQLARGAVNRLIPAPMC